MNYQIRLLKKCCDSAGVYKAAQEILKKGQEITVHACWRMHGASYEYIPHRLDFEMSRGGEGNQECHNDRNNDWLKHFLPT